MAKQVGVSPATVQRIWSGRGLKPHLVKTFKLSNDPLFEEKLIDVVGLYVNPPEKAVVLCMDEKISIQALDHTQASLPLTKGRAGTTTSDYREAVGYDEDGAEGHSCAGDEGVEQSEGGQGQGCEVVSEGPEQVALDGPEGGSGKADGIGGGV